METRHKSEVTFEAAGDEKPGPIMSFQLVRTEWGQSRRNDRENWRDNSNRERKVIATDLTRHALTSIIESAADWLAYIEAG